MLELPERFAELRSVSAEDLENERLEEGTRMLYLAREDQGLVLAIAYFLGYAADEDIYPGEVYAYCQVEPGEVEPGYGVPDPLIVASASELWFYPED